MVFYEAVDGARVVACIVDDLNTERGCARGEAIRCFAQCHRLHLICTSSFFIGKRAFERRQSGRPSRGDETVKFEGEKSELARDEFLVLTAPTAD